MQNNIIRHLLFSLLLMQNIALANSKALEQVSFYDIPKEGGHYFIHKGECKYNSSFSMKKAMERFQEKKSLSDCKIFEAKKYDGVFLLICSKPASTGEAYMKNHNACKEYLKAVKKIQESEKKN